MIEIQIKRTLATEPDQPTYLVTDADVEAFRSAFPNIVIETELAEIASYCRANPTKRWTIRGVSKAIHENLRRKNDRAVSTGKYQNDRDVKPDPKRGGAIEDYGNYVLTWSLGERMIEAAWAGMRFEPSEEMRDYRPKVNLNRLVGKIVEDMKHDGKTINYAYAALTRTLRQHWHE